MVDYIFLVYDSGFRLQRRTYAHSIQSYIGIQQVRKRVLYLLNMSSQEQKNYYLQLVNPQVEIGLRYQAIFQLKHINTDTSIQQLIQAYPFLAQSVLLSHEVLYTLGQLNQDKIVLIKDFLISVVQDEKENNLSRHESAQGLANYFLDELVDLYKKHSNSECKELKWTCQIALQKVQEKQLIKSYGQKFNETKEPAAPFTEQQFNEYIQNGNFEQLYKEKGYLGLLLREDIELFHKYRILYLMRNQKGNDCIRILCQLLSKQYFKTQTSLLKHEICFILGQIGCEGYEHLVRQCIENEEQEAIVRHEALAAVASQSKDSEYLNKFINDKDMLIQESAKVAQFQIHYWND